jgi:benzil reductase ((S)-benzoin forming)
MKYFIITGTSRGLGEALAKGLMEENNHLICISRGNNTELISEAENKGVNLDYINYDLNDINNIDKLMENVFYKINFEIMEAIYLINNAGIVKPIAPIERCEHIEIIENVNINLLAPMLIVSSFITLTSELKVEKRVINISSGAGKKPYHGWSCYCSTKAGIDMFTKTVAFEQENKDYPVKILSFAPGIIDTKMQEQIRSSSEEEFAHIERFMNFKKQGLLLKPREVAEVIIRLLFDENFEQGGIDDIKNYIKK